ETMPPVLRGEMLLDRMGGGQARLSYEQLKKDAIDLEAQIKMLQDGLDALARIQARSLESNLYAKVNEIQEEISLKKYDYRATQLHLAAVRAQTLKCDDEDNVRYKLPPASAVQKIKIIEKKQKPKPKIKVNFWSTKQPGSRLKKPDAFKENNNRRHTVGDATDSSKPKPSLKVCKRVSFLPSPVFTENHIPMVTVPDDLTIQLNEEEANDLREDLNFAFVNSLESESKLDKKSKTSMTQTSPKGAKRKRSEDFDTRSHNNENELEFFSKYVVQKLRRMETNQRIYSENLINTVLMLGQLGKLNGKSKILEA
ncbi:hypothetical protein KGM_215857B, partial [Danaus plexippus plexippus]